MDLVIMDAAASAATSACQDFVSQMATILNSPSGKALATEAAGIAKIAVEEGVDVAKMAMDVIEKNPELLAEKSAPGALYEASRNIVEDTIAEKNTFTHIPAKDLLPNLEKAFIDPRKLTEYALNPEHVIGGNKARVFNSVLGYTKSDASSLIKQIYENLPRGEAILGKLDQFGQRYTVDIQITGLNGKIATVRTGWIIKTGSENLELTTIYVK